MPSPSATHSFGPQNAELLVRTRRSGAAARAGHDLVIEVSSWSGTLELGEEAEQSSVALRADGASLRVREGTGGMQPLGEDDKESISKAIDEDVLKRSAIEFHSRAIEGDPGQHLRVEGELELMGQRRPLQFELTIADEKLTGSATVRQSEWGIKQYSILFGTIKVVDEVEVTIAGDLSS